MNSTLPRRRTRAALLICVLLLAACADRADPAAGPGSPVNPAPEITEEVRTIPVDEMLVNENAFRSATFHINTLAYELPAMDAVEVVNLTYANRGSRELTLDLYYPPDTPASARPPVAIFGLGYRMSNLRLRNAHFYTSWGRLVAAAGMVGVTYDTEQPDEDLVVLVDFLRKHADELGLDGERIGFMSSSGNTATVISHLMQPGRGGFAFSVYYYGLALTPDRKYLERYEEACMDNACLLEELADVSYVDLEMPVMIVEVGQDFVPLANEAMDYFAAYLKEEGADVTLVFYEEGAHGFDTEQQTEESAAVIAQTIEFMLASFNR